MDPLEKQKEIERLKALVLSAFSPVPYPGDEDIVSDHSGTYEDVGEMEAAFRGKNWRNLTDIDMLRYRYDSIIFFSPAAYRYFLPAYLMASLVDRSKADLIPDCVIFSIEGPLNQGDEFRSEWLARFQLMSAIEKECLTEWVRFFHRYYHPSDYGGHIANALATLSAP